MEATSSCGILISISSIPGGGGTCANSNDHYYELWHLSQHHTQSQPGDLPMTNKHCLELSSIYTPVACTREGEKK